MQAHLASDAHRIRIAVELDEYATITCMRVGGQPGPHGYIQQTYRGSEKAGLKVTCTIGDTVPTEC
jgi:hypothetical protein